MKNGQTSEGHGRLRKENVKVIEKEWPEEMFSQAHVQIVSKVTNR